MVNWEGHADGNTLFTNYTGTGWFNSKSFKISKISVIVVTLELFGHFEIIELTNLC